MTKLTPREWIDQASKLTGDDHDLPDWYYVLLHSAEENCLRRVASLDRLLDQKHWQVPRPAVTLLAWRNQLGNFKVAWEPTFEQMLVEQDKREFSLSLLGDLLMQRNEIMSIKKPSVPNSRDDRMDQAAAALCNAMVSQFGLIAEELAASFDLTVAGHLKAATEVKGHPYAGLAASSAPYGG